jgi:hypothetical protein
VKVREQASSAFAWIKSFGPVPIDIGVADSAGSFAAGSGRRNAINAAGID